VHYSIQRDYLHVIVEASSAAALGRGMRSLGARLARAVNRTRSRRGPVLRDRYHVRVLRTPREVRNAIAYVLLNARTHAARRGRPQPRSARIDPASSGRWFDGWKGRVPEAPDLPAVASARTWLVRAGWRRAGLVSFTEVSGCEPDRPTRSEPRRPQPQRPQPPSSPTASEEAAGQEGSWGSRARAAI